LPAELTTHYFLGFFQFSSLRYSVQRINIRLPPFRRSKNRNNLKLKEQAIDKNFFGDQDSKKREKGQSNPKKFLGF